MAAIRAAVIGMSLADREEIRKRYPTMKRNEDEKIVDLEERKDYQNKRNRFRRVK